MSKDARLTIRIDAELDQWLGEQGALNGLDKATFARMLLFRARNGQAEYSQVEHGYDQVELLTVEASEVDIDALVADRLAHANTERPVRMQEVAPEDPVLQELGMRPHRVAPPPAFGEKSPRITRASTWAPSGGSSY